MITKLKLALLIAAPLVAGTATYALAGGGTVDHKEMLQKFDTNKDGKLDDAERAQMKAAFEAKRAEREKEMLAKYDTNKDGKLDASERKVMKDEKAAAEFKKLDTNGDGKLSLDEFKAGREGKFGHHGRHGHGKGRTRGAAGGMKP